MSSTNQQKVDPTPALKKQKVVPTLKGIQTCSVPSLDDTHHSTLTGRTTQVSPQNAGKACYEASREGKNGILYLVGTTGVISFEVTRKMRLAALRSAKLGIARQAHDYLSRQQELLHVKLQLLAEARIRSMLQEKSGHEPTSSETDTEKKTEALCREAVDLRTKLEQLKALDHAPGEMHVMADNGERVLVKVDQVPLVASEDQKDLLVLIPRNVHARLGDYEVENHNQSVYLFNPLTNNLWISTDMKTPFDTYRHSAANFFTGEICLAGGKRGMYGQHAVSDFKVWQRQLGLGFRGYGPVCWSSPLDPESNWSSCQTPRSGGQLVNVENLFLFVLGGMDDDNRLVPTVERLDPAQKVWNKVTDLPYAMRKYNQRGTINAVSLGDKIYVLKAAQRSLYVYCTASNRWTELKQVPFENLSRSPVTMCVVGGRIVFGNDRAVHFYIPLSKEYGTLTPPKNKEGTTLAGYSGVVLRIGGVGDWSLYCETTKKWKVLKRNNSDFLGSCQVVRVSSGDL